MPTTDINLNLSYVESVTGTAVDNTDPLNPIVNTPSGIISGVGTVDYVPRILTIDGDGNILTVEDSNIYDWSGGILITKSDADHQTIYTQEPLSGFVLGYASLTSDVTSRIDNAQGRVMLRWSDGVDENNLKVSSLGVSIFGSAVIAGRVTYYADDGGGGGILSSADTTVYQLGILSTAQQSNGYLKSDGGVLSWAAVSGGGTTTNPLTIGTGLSGTSFDGSAAVTIEIDSTVATLTGNQVLTNKTLTSPVIGAIVGLNGQIAHTTTAQASGAIIDYLFTPSNHTGQTASTNSPVFRIAASTKTFATGAITNAYGTHIESTTLAFAASSTVTNSYGLYVEANKLGTNAVFTNTYGIGTNGFLRIGVGATTQGTIIRNDTTANYAAIYNGNVTPSNTNFALKYNGATAWMNATTGGSIILSFTAASVLSISSGTAINIAEGVSMNAGTTTGLKIGGATTHKLALWNKTPIVQPTTAITGATLVSNAGTTITSTDTFGGYTLQQIAAALVNFGLLA